LNWSEDLMDDPDFNTTYSISQLLSIRKLKISSTIVEVHITPDSSSYNFLQSPQSVIQFKMKNTQMWQTPTHFACGCPKAICNDFVSRDCTYQDTLLPLILWAAKIDQYRALREGILGACDTDSD